MIDPQNRAADSRFFVERARYWFEIHMNFLIKFLGVAMSSFCHWEGNILVLNILGRHEQAQRDW